MFKALLKKQFLELGNFYVQNKKTGKKRSTGAIIGLIVLFAFVFFSIGFMFYELAAFMLAPFEEAGLTWLVFALFGAMATALGVFGSVFNTYSGLYHAKDNELLLSMPIPPRALLTVRLISVYAMGLLFESLVLIPTIVCYWVIVPPTVWTVIFPILLWLALGFVVLALTCLLGWLVALIAARVKNKSFVSVLLTVTFLVVYYFVYFRLNTMLQNIVANPDPLKNAMQGPLFPFYVFGAGAVGGVWQTAAFVLGVAALFGLTVWVLSRSFVRIVTTNRGAARYKERGVVSRTSKPDKALLRREFRRLAASPTYMLNCCLGELMIPAALIFLLIKGSDIFLFAEQLRALGATFDAFIPVGALAALMLILSMNDITAPSISLEGSSVWIVQSMPVNAFRVLLAKVKMHVYLTLPLAVIAAGVLTYLLDLDLLTGGLLIVAAGLFVLVAAQAGLAFNLKMPSLQWTNETVPVKQSASVTLALFGGWGVAFAVFGLFFLAGKVMSPTVYLGIIAALLLAACTLLYRWLKTRGARIFEEL